MNILSVQYFLAIVEEGNISAAARKLFISQQTLSEHVKKLEEELDAPLFRRGKKLSLTPAGEVFVIRGRDLIGRYDALLSDMREVTSTRRSRIAIAIPTCATPDYLPEIIARYRAKYPLFEVSIKKRQHNDIAHNISGVDLYMSYLPLDDGLENYTLLEDDPYHVVFHRALAEKIYGPEWDEIEKRLIETQDLGLLRRMPFLLQLDRYFRLSVDMQMIFQEYQFTPIVAMNSESSELNAVFCRQGVGCLMAPHSLIHSRFFANPQRTASDLLSYPIRVSSFKTKLAVSYEKGRHLHAAERAFLEEAAAWFKT